MGCGRGCRGRGRDVGVMWVWVGGVVGVGVMWGWRREEDSGWVVEFLEGVELVFIFE